jgi:hypothetical protein
MLKTQSKVYFYVVSRDFGFAPNPFHGTCTLATCKPAIRRCAQIGDWVIGMGGSRLSAAGRCIFAMRVSDTRTFDQYWSNIAYFDKRPVRNGSRRMMIGDNIYHRQDGQQNWHQEDSHHSNPDGSINEHNLLRDTKADRVLISRHFFYFGASAPLIPVSLLREIGFTNGIGHRVYPLGTCSKILSWLERRFSHCLNQVVNDPFDFNRSNARYSVKTDKVT